MALDPALQEHVDPDIWAVLSNMDESLATINTALEAITARLDALESAPDPVAALRIMGIDLTYNTGETDSFLREE